MTDLRTAAQQALKSMEKATGFMYDSVYRSLNKSIEDLKDALAQPTPEPVAWGVFEGENLHDFYTLREDAEKMAGYKGSHATVMPLYTAPPQRKPLTEEEIDQITRDRWGTQLLGVMVRLHHEYARAIERAHGIGGNDG